MANDLDDWSSMAADLAEAWQELADANDTAHTRDEADMDKVMDVLNERFDGWFSTSGDEEQSVWDRFHDIRAEQTQAYDDLKTYWDDHLAEDVPNTKLVYDAAMAWTDGVLPELGDHETTIAQSPARMQWTGPGAEAYSKKLPDQVAAMGELKTHITNAADGAERAAGIMATIYGAILNDLGTLATTIEDLPGDSTGATFAVRMYNARAMMDQYKETLEKYYSGEGVWDDAADDASAIMAESEPDAEVLNAGTWPVASSESLQDMQPGTPTNPGPTPQLPQPPTEPTTPTAPVQPDLSDVDQPTPVDPSNQDRTNTEDVGDEAND